MEQSVVDLGGRGWGFGGVWTYPLEFQTILMDELATYCFSKR